MFIAAIAGLAIAIFYGSKYALREKGNDQLPTNADTAAAVAAGTSSGTTGTTGTSGSPSTPSACTDVIRTDLSSDASFTTWKSSINSASTLKTDLDNVNAHIACLKELTDAVNATPTRLSTLQTNAANIDKAIEQARLDVKIAKDRAALALNPNLNRSYYDGWFPLDRPLKHMTYPLLIGFGLFFCSIGFFYFMALVGIDVTLLVTVPAVQSTGVTQFTSAFWVMGGVAAVLLGLTVYGFTR